jgi:upstream activation factor subunit UAF30
MKNIDELPEEDSNSNASSPTATSKSKSKPTKGKTKVKVKTSSPKATSASKASSKKSAASSSSAASKASKKTKHTKDDAVDKSKSKSKSTSSTNAFTKPRRISAALAELINVPSCQESRSQVVSKLWAYIKSNNLQNPANKREIVVDEKLKAVFKTESLTMFSINKHLNDHFLGDV